MNHETQKDMTDESNWTPDELQMARLLRANGATVSASIVNGKRVFTIEASAPAAAIRLGCQATITAPER
jgi:hypothetical protein